MGGEIKTEVRPLRADAVRNREKILAAAAVLFAERGLEVSLDDVAHEAGVGVGTLYRRFADKEALVEALFENAVQEIVSLAVRANAAQNSWDGLVWFLEQVLQRQCANRGLREVVVGTSYGQVRIAEAKRRIVPSISALIKRAQHDGYLRRDVVDADFPILESMISSIGTMTSISSPDLWRRYLTIILDGLAAERSGPSLLGAGPPSEAAHDEILRSKRLQTLPTHSA